MSEATSVACDFRIIPSSSGFSAFAASVAPVVVMSTMSSAEPAAGAPSVAPRLSTTAIIRHALLGEEAAREVHILRRNPHPLSPARAIGRRDILEIGHGAHVDPGARRGDDDIGVSESEGAQEFDFGVDIGDLFAHQILARDAEMGCAGGELADDLGAGDVGDLDPWKADQRPAIVACAAPLREFETGPGKKGARRLLQAALGGHGQNERRFAGSRGVEGHQSAPVAGSRSIAIAAPTAGMSALAPRRFASPS